MKKISIYWKTGIVSIAIILITIVILFIVISILTPSITQDIQKERFDNQVEEISDIVKSSGIDEEKLRKVSDHSLYYEISKNKQLLYNSIEVEVNPNNQQVESEESFLVPAFGEDQLFEKKEIVQYQDNIYELYATKTITFTQEESGLFLKKVLPYFLLIGIVAASILSLLYAKYFSNKINHLSSIMNQMKNKTYASKKEKIDGDELQKLENDINSLYTQLLDEIVIVNKFEEERQLFLRGITHELKTPIMAMGVTIEGILAKVDGYDNYELALQECYQQLQAMSNLVNEILELAKIQAIKDVGCIHVGVAIDQVLEMYQYSFVDKDIRVIKRYYGDGTFMIPQNHFDKVLSNLISNVAKYTPRKGEFIIEVNDNNVCFMNTIYKDAKIDVDKIFEAFVSSNVSNKDNFHKSHGLGLYICASILDQYSINYHCCIEDNKFCFVINR